jgi:hypothetical protein
MTSAASGDSFEWYEKRLYDIRVVEVERHGDSHLRLHFDGPSAGVLVVSLDGVHFDDDNPENLDAQTIESIQAEFDHGD